MNNENFIFWSLFLVIILSAAFYDLWIMGKRKKEISIKEAGFWTLGWIFLALFFNLLIYIFIGHQKALEFLTAYLLEKSLSLDNLFVFLVTFSYFDIAPIFQRKILKLGILGAFLMRAVFIFGGIWLLRSFDFLFFIFGAFLIFSGIKLIFQKEEKVNPGKNIFLRIIRKFIPLVEDVKECRFFLKVNGKFCLTHFFVVLLLIESADLVFAIDSVPAVLAITQDPFIAYTSNAFAILGLRALYFFLIGFLPRFIYLKKGIIALLIFIGFKMTLNNFFHMPILFSLAVIISILTVAVIMSILKQRKETNADSQ